MGSSSTTVIIFHFCRYLPLLSLSSTSVIKHLLLSSNFVIFKTMIFFSKLFLVVHLLESRLGDEKAFYRLQAFCRSQAFYRSPQFSWSNFTWICDKYKNYS